MLANASVILMLLAASPKLVIVTPSTSKYQVVTGKNTTAETIRTIIGKSISNGLAFPLSSPNSSISPGASPYAWLYRLPVVS